MKILKNEDWLAVFLGFFITALVLFGLITRVPW